MTVDQPFSGNAISIELPNNLFALQAEASVFTPERIQRELANNPEAPHLEVDEEIITCCGMWIPNVYASLCLGNNLTPVDIWNCL